MPKTQYKKHTIILGVTLLAIVIFGIMFQRYARSLEPPMSFTWDTVSSRENLPELGVNSGGLRSVYGYRIDPEANVFEYINDSNGCMVTINYGTTSVNADEGEQKLTDQVLQQSSQSTIVNKSIRYNYGQLDVPVRATTAEEDENGRPTVYVARVFAQESKQFKLKFSCEDASIMNEELDNVLDGVVFLPEQTSF